MHGRRHPRKDTVTDANELAGFDVPRHGDVVAKLRRRQHPTDLPKHTLILFYLLYRGGIAVGSGANRNPTAKTENRRRRTNVRLHFIITPRAKL